MLLSVVRFTALGQWGGMESCLVVDSIHFPIDSLINGNPLTTYNSANGYSLPAKDTLRVLVVFAEINYDVGTDPNPNSTPGWSVHSLPTWANNLYDPYPPTGNPIGLLTKYFLSASTGNYLLLGDYLLAPNNGGIFSVNNSSVSGLDYEGALCTEIDQTMNGNFVTGHGLNDQSYFDLWTKTSSGIAKIHPSIDDPGRYDHVVFIWRNHEYNGRGYSVGSSNDSFLGYNIDTYTFQGTWDRIPTNIVRHEYAHQLLGGNDFHAGGGGWGNTGDYWIPRTAGWSLLGLYGCSFLTWNAWDRYRLDWNAPGNTFNPSARNSDNSYEVNGDLDATDPSDEGIYTLRDFMTTGDAIRIKIPFIDPDTEFPQYLWLENHNGIALNGNPFDQWQYQSNGTCVDSASYGLYAYMQIDREVKESTSWAEIFQGHADYLRPIIASGFYDREFESAQYFNTCIQWGYTQPFIVGEPNPLTGGSDQEYYTIDVDNNGEITQDDQLPNAVKKIDGVYIEKLFQNGHTSHGFRLGENSKIGIGTNPSSASMMNLVGKNAPIYSEKNLRKIYLNGISIEILEQNANGNIKVDIQFDQIDIQNDVRWCADEIVLSPIQSSTGYSLNITEGNTLLLDQGITATGMENPVLFEGNYIFTKPTIFRCTDGSYLHLDENSIIDLQNQTTFILENGSTLELEDDAFLNVSNSCSLVLRDGSFLIIHGSGEALIEDGGYLCIEQGAQIELLDEESHLVLNDGWISGINPNITIYPSPNCVDFCDIDFSGEGEIIDESITTFYNDLVIEETTNWDSEQYNFMSDLIIEEDGVLNIINSSIGFSKYSKIIIERGGILNIDGTLITSLWPCSNKHWQGIQVWGTASASQSIAGAQGKITIVNGGAIENAIAAVRLAKSDGIRYEPGFEGGIIQTNDAHFINNRTGVKFYPYRNMVSGVEMDNLSYFRNSEFLTGSELADESIPEDFLHLNGVKGININGCSFTNSRPEQEAGMSDRGIGINSYDASFTVTWYCASSYPCEEPVLSTFTNLNYGINARNATTSGAFDVNHSEFNNNLTGIYFNNIDYADIIFNDFELYNVSLFHEPDDIFGGLYIDNCSGYTIEENNFFNDDEYDPQNEISSIGITVNNSGDDVNMIYRNTFNRLHIGILAQNRNRGTSIGTGLKLKCNICTNNQGDFAVTADTASANKGISIYQGTNTSTDKTAPAGNLFTHANNNDPYSDFNNTLSRQWNYYFHHPGTAQNLWVPVYYQNITPTSNGTYPFIFDSVCPSHFTVGGGLKSSAYVELNEEELRSRMILMENLRDSAANDLSLWIDAGDTPELNYEVESSTPDESLELYDELIADSPYLSDTVLSSSIEKEEVLVNAMIRDIMVANPHGVKKEELIGALKQRIPPVPDYMMAEIMAGLDSIAQKEVRESEIAWYAQEREIAFDKLVKIYLCDSNQESAGDSLVALILDHGNINSHYYLATRYLEQNNFTNATLILVDIPDQFELEPGQQAEYQDYQTVFSIINNVLQEGMPLDSIDNISRQILYQIAENDSRPAIIAQNILHQIDSVDYPEIYILPTSGPITRRYLAEIPDKDSDPEQGNLFRVYPNPGRDYFIIEYSFERVPDQASYSISDQNGRIIEEGPIEGKQNQLIRRTTSYSSGLYTIKLIINGNTEKTLKINIIK